MIAQCSRLYLINPVRKVGCVPNELEIVDLSATRSRAREVVPSDTEDNDKEPKLLCILCSKRVPNILFGCRHACCCSKCIKRQEFRFPFENDSSAVQGFYCKVRFPYHTNFKQING